MKPLLSLVVVAYNIPLQLERTLRSFAHDYQQLSKELYEIIIVDNGSTPAVEAEFCAQFGFTFRLVRVSPAPPSPAYAINVGLSAARAEVIGVMIDGARMVSPGLFRFALEGVLMRERTIAFSLGYYIGFDYQSFAMQWGDHDFAYETALLESINWPEDGYRLFEVATPDESSGGSGLMPLGESNALFARASIWAELGGADERFAEPGGGLVNIDLYKRALALPDAQPVVLLGEATFHQAHGGTATNANPDRFNEKMAVWRDNYERIAGKALVFPPEFPGKRPIYLGSPRQHSLTRLSCDHLYSIGVDGVTGVLASRPVGPLDEAHRAEVALIAQSVRSGDLSSAIYMARLARRRIGSDADILRWVLSFLPGAFDPRSGGFETRDARFNATMQTNAARIFEAGGFPDRAAEAYQRALDADPTWVAAHLGLAQAKYPGPLYYEWLDVILDALRPAAALEIGVFEGESLARYKPPTQVIAIDPTPRAMHSLTALTFVFPEESDVFFAKLPERTWLPRGIDYSFIDGLHTFPQALRDFINCEAYSHPGAICLVHDTIPLNEITQRPERETGFHTGDVWKLVVCLARHRPDLVIWTLPCAPSGLTIISSLDPGNETLRRSYDAIMAECDALSYDDLKGNEVEMLKIRHVSKDELAALLARPPGTRDEAAPADIAAVV